MPPFARNQDAEPHLHAQDWYTLSVGALPYTNRKGSTHEGSIEKGLLCFFGPCFNRYFTCHMPSFGAYVRITGWSVLREHGFYHGDISCNNVMIDLANVLEGTSVAKHFLIDLGLALSVEDSYRQPSVSGCVPRLFRRSSFFRERSNSLRRDFSRPPTTSASRNVTTSSRFFGWRFTQRHPSLKPLGNSSISKEA